MDELGQLLSLFGTVNTINDTKTLQKVSKILLDPLFTAQSPESIKKTLFCLFKNNMKHINNITDNKYNFQHQYM